MLPRHREKRENKLCLSCRVIILFGPVGTADSEEVIPLPGTVQHGISDDIIKSVDACSWLTSFLYSLFLVLRSPVARLKSQLRTHARACFFFVMVYWKMFIEVSRMLTIEGSWTRWSLTKEYVVLASIELDQVKGETEHTRLRLVLFDVH